MLLNRTKKDAGQTARKPWSKPALAAAILGLAAILAVAASGIGYRLGWRHFTVGQEITRWAVYGAALALVLAATGLIQARPSGTRRGLAPAVLGLLLALPPVAMALHWEYVTRTTPPINDNRGSGSSRASSSALRGSIAWSPVGHRVRNGANLLGHTAPSYPRLAPLVVSHLATGRHTGKNTVAPRPLIHRSPGRTT